MTIQRRARITTAVLILFVVGTVAILFWNSSQVGEGIKTIDTTSRAVDSAFMMRILMVDYLADRDARTLKEWEMHRETLGRIINDMSAGSTDEALLADLKGNYQTVGAIADKVVRLLSVRDAADRLQASDAKGMIDKLMLLKLEQLVDAAHDLSKATQSLTLGRRYFVQQIIIAIGFLGLAFIVINVYLMRKSVVQPLKLLSNEADKIGAGDFACVQEIHSDDEVGNLSRAFKEMVARLQQRDIALRQARDEIALRLEERSAALQRTKAYNNMLQAIQRVQTQFIANSDSEELFGTLLEDLLAVSESEFGFVGELLYTETGQPYLKDRAITDIAWDEESRKVYERFAGDHGLEFHDIHGLWGAVILSGEPVISPDPRNDPKSSGLPPGHPPLNAFLGIPFHSDGKVIGMAGLANRPGGYDRDMLDFLQPYASTCASVIEAYRNENRRRETEQRLFDTNQRLQALMEALPVGISFTNDTSCERITGNPCLFDQFEMTPDANISASASDEASAGRLVRYRHMGRDITDTELPLQRAIAENRVIPPMELEIQLPSGRRWFAEASGAPIVDSQGTVVGGVAVTVDITERKRIEQERETTIDFLHLVNETHGTEELIRATAVFFQQRSGCEAVGIRLREGHDYPYFEARGFPEEFILLETHLCTYDRNGQVCLDSLGNPVLECMCGNVICERFDPSKPFFTETGSFWTNSTTELLASTTEKDRQASTRNRCNGEGYESVALIPLGARGERCGLLQLNDKRKGRFTAETMTLWERLAQYLSVAWGKFKAEEDLQEAKEQLEIRVQERTAALGEANRILQEEMIERQRVQGERERLIAELEAKNAELERFTYSVSHDLKSPLITIRSFVGFIQEDLPSGNIQDVERDLERISKAAEKMGQLLDEILELSRIGRMVNPPTEIAMEDLAHEVLELLAGRIADRSAKVDIAAGLPVVHGDRPRLLEVLQNLIENALKFMGDQPHPAIEVGARQECGEVIFYVQDNGVGIDPSYQERVFGLFDKLDQNSEGTGIGLALVKRIVEVHGGRIWVESAGFGKGSTFYFTIPRAVQTCEAPTEKLP